MPQNKAEVSYAVNFRGEDPPIPTPVIKVLTQAPETVVLVGGKSEVPFRFENEGQREVVFSEITATSTSSKVTATLAKTIMRIPAGGTVENKLTIQANQKLTPLDIGTVTINGVEK